MKREKLSVEVIERAVISLLKSGKTTVTYADVAVALGRGRKAGQAVGKLMDSVYDRDVKLSHKLLPVVCVQKATGLPGAGVWKRILGVNPVVKSNGEIVDVPPVALSQLAKLQGFVRESI